MKLLLPVTRKLWVVKRQDAALGEVYASMWTPVGLKHYRG